MGNFFNYSSNDKFSSTVLFVGAGLGRIVGEAMHVWFPNGVGIAGIMNPIVPGAYSVAGAAAFAGKKRIFLS